LEPDEIRAPPPHEISVDDVIVEEEREMQQFNARRQPNRPCPRLTVESFECADEQPRPQQLAAEETS
jgi:hypothetical protein